MISELSLFTSAVVNLLFLNMSGGHDITLETHRSLVDILAIPQLCIDSGQVVHTHLPPSPTNIIW